MGYRESVGIHKKVLVAPAAYLLIGGVAILCLVLWVVDTEFPVVAGLARGLHEEQRPNKWAPL